MTYRIKGVVLHWAASSYKVSDNVKKHYNFVIDEKGTVHNGLHPLSHQTPPLNSGGYAAHTKSYNSYQAGIGLLGMHGAKEKPFNAGKYPLTKIQFMEAVRLTAKICIEHKITVTAKSILTHAEVQGTLGIKQSGKWDITRLPWDDSIVGGTAVGSHYRNLVRAEMDRLIFPPKQSPWAGLFKAIAGLFRRKK